MKPNTNISQTESKQDAPLPKQEEHKKRTTGNVVFDLLVYPSIAFGAVFAFSIWMLHTTKFGNGKFRQKYDSVVEGTAKWFGETLFKGQSAEALHKKADNYISVLVSFAAGTVLIAPIKILEDYRGRISHKIDKFFDSEPRDPSHYLQEPRQSWASVMGGRAITFGTVLGLATLAGKHINRGADHVADKIAWEYKQHWNVRATKAQVKNVKSWSFVSAFEGFYTALCAALIYVFSRGLASKFNKEEEELAKAAKTDTAPDSTQNVTPAITAEPVAKPQRAVPKLAAGYAEQEMQRQLSAETAVPLRQ